jgi:hypothetical protein
MPLEIIIPLAAIVILLLIFGWSIRVLGSTIKPLLTIVAILLLLQIAFGVNSKDVLQEMMQIVTKIQQLLTDN